MAGKGDKSRIASFRKWFDNFDKIDWTKKEPDKNASEVVDKSINIIDDKQIR